MKLIDLVIVGFLLVFLSYPASAYTRDGGSFGVGTSAYAEGYQSSFGGRYSQKDVDYSGSVYEDVWVDGPYTCTEKVSYDLLTGDTLYKVYVYDAGSKEGVKVSSGITDVTEAYYSNGAVRYMGRPVYSKYLNRGYGSYIEPGQRLGDEYGPDGAYGRSMGSEKRFLLENTKGLYRNDPIESTNTGYFQESSSGRGFHGRVWG